MDTAAFALGKLASELTFEDLPQEVVNRLERLILDTIGCALGAVSSEPCVIAREVVEELGGRPESTVIGTPLKTNCANATLVNGSQIRYLDFNDTYFSPSGRSVHPSNCIAEALAVGERQHASGREVIIAAALGYEIQCRFIDTFRMATLFHHTIGGFEAPVVAGRLLGLDAGQIAEAVGIGGSHNLASNGIYGEGFVSMIKSSGYAFGSQSGVVAALMAQKGFTGPTTILESYNRLFEGNVSLAPLVAPIEDWAVLKSWFKPFMAVHPSHSAITALLEIVQKHSVVPDQVERIRVRTFRRGTGEIALHHPAPENKEEADHNQAYLLAMALLDGEVGPAQYEREQWKDARVRDLIERTEFEAEPAFDGMFPASWPTIVELTLKDGSTLSERVDFPKGGPRNPMSDREIEAKFRGLATGVLPSERINQVIEMAYDLDSLDDVSKLMDLLRT